MKRNTVFWGAVLIVVGALLLLDNLDILPFSVWGLLWPLLLIAAGVWVLLGVSRGGRAVETQQVSIPLEGEPTARVKLSHGAGELRVSSGAAPGYLLSGTFNGGVEYRSTREAGRQIVRLKSPPVFVAPWDMFGRNARLWSVELNSDIPLSLEIESGASSSRIDLSGVRLTDLELEFGASSADVSLPAGAGHTRVKIEAGAASVTLRLPQQAEARIRYESGLSSLNLDRARFAQSANSYQTAGFDAATDRLDIDIESGVGSVTIL